MKTEIVLTNSDDHFGCASLGYIPRVTDMQLSDDEACDYEDLMYARYIKKMHPEFKNVRVYDGVLYFEK